MIFKNLQSKLPAEKVSSAVYIRNFQPTDLAVILEIVTKTFNEYYDYSLILDSYAQWHEGILLATYKGKIIGVLVGREIAPGYARILIFAVDENYRSQGIGSRLLTTFIHECQRRGILKIVLEVNVNNWRAIRLYIKFGFRITQVLNYYYSNGDHAYQMEYIVA